ncbi:MAG TPA: Plug domain-containing protein, partial [Candidatus Goldiibacteriota bacterium]|nr:Plug domain-containing protein [Candidatus Goldiibacteriota bacterium]
MNKLRQVTFNAMCLLAAFLPAATAMDTMEIIVDASSDGKYYESVYGLSEIGEIKPRSAAELISDAAGLNITSKSFPLLQAHARVNGGSFEQVLIFLDGFRMNSVQTGHYNFDLPVTMLDIAAAGVSGRAGYGAFSGFVDLMTIRHEKDALRAAAEYGSYDTWYSAFSGTKVIGDFSA